MLESGYEFCLLHSSANVWHLYNSTVSAQVLVWSVTDELFSEVGLREYQSKMTITITVLSIHVPFEGVTRAAGAWLRRSGSWRQPQTFWFVDRGQRWWQLELFQERSAFHLLWWLPCCQKAGCRQVWWISRSSWGLGHPLCRSFRLWRRAGCR